MADDLDHLRGDPHGCIRRLNKSGTVPGAHVAVVRHHTALTVLDVSFEPPPAQHLPGYPAEHVRVTVLADGSIFAVPVEPADRNWLHRYQRHPIHELPTLPKEEHEIANEHLFGSLCLEYPSDPSDLRWHWSDGVDAYLRIVQRHLWCEEHWRRHGRWPVEDVPHGDRPDGHPHPVTVALRII